MDLGTCHARKKRRSQQAKMRSCFTKKVMGIFLSACTLFFSLLLAGCTESEAQCSDSFEETLAQHGLLKLPSPDDLHAESYCDSPTFKEGKGAEVLEALVPSCLDCVGELTALARAVSSAWYAESVLCELPELGSREELIEDLSVRIDELNERVRLARLCAAR